MQGPEASKDDMYLGKLYHPFGNEGQLLYDSELVLRKSSTGFFSFFYALVI